MARQPRRHIVAAAMTTLLLVGLVGCAEQRDGAPEASTAPVRPSAPPSAPAPRPADINALKQVVTGASEGETAIASPHASGGGETPGGPLRVADLRLAPPATWQATVPTSSMRRAQYSIPGPAGPAEAVVFFFGAGQGGGVKDNIDRWVGQFEAKGDPLPAADRLTSVERPGVKVTIVRTRGTYHTGGMGMGGPPATHDGYALAGLILESPGGPVFIKITGPAATLDAAKADIDMLIASIERTP